MFLNASLQHGFTTHLTGDCKLGRRGFLKTIPLHPKCWSPVNISLRIETFIIHNIIITNVLED